MITRLKMVNLIFQMTSTRHEGSSPDLSNTTQIDEWFKKVRVDS